MTDTDSKQIRQAEFMLKHTLTDSDLRKMIQEKFERAVAYNKAKIKRERQAELA